jgi:hypothetical protein
VKHTVTLAALLAAPLLAQAEPLHWPVACTLGRNCFVQNYVDHGPDANGSDFTCGHLTYTHHDGTDIRLTGLEAMHAGVNVLAAADGEVVGTRDGMPDHSIRDENGDTAIGLAAVRGHECGNGVGIRHADGLRTQYCHMRHGSIAVRTGDKVKAGDILGQVGLSGNTEFPHLHITVWKDDAVVDPFTSTPMTQACAAPDATHPPTQLWATQEPYIATALLADGFTDHQPEHNGAENPPPLMDHIANKAPALVYWSTFMGPQSGDVLTLTLTAPDGKVLAGNRHSFDHSMAQYYSYIGMRNHSTLAPGHYKAEATLTRADASAPVVKHVRELVIE